MKDLRVNNFENIDLVVVNFYPFEKTLRKTTSHSKIIENIDTEINFVITDFKNELLVSFKGSVPNLFEEGKGVVAEGFLKDRSYLKAVKILAKHDENYMPPEVNEALKGKK